MGRVRVHPPLFPTTSLISVRRCFSGVLGAYGMFSGGGYLPSLVHRYKNIADRILRNAITWRMENYKGARPVKHNASFSHPFLAQKSVHDYLAVTASTRIYVG